MQLEDIAKKYRDSLVSFFSEETVIEEIYKEQYGEENYTANKATYNAKFRHILDNTVFIPFIKLEHLEEFLKKESGRYLEKKTHSGQTIKDIEAERIRFYKQNYGEEYKIYRLLLRKRVEILEKYTSSFFEQLNAIIPEFMKYLNPQGLKDQKNIYKMPETMNDVAELEKIVKDYIDNHNKSFLDRLKSKKIDKLLQKYIKGVKEKLIIETSTYFMHKRDIPHGKYDVDILETMIEGGASVQQSIGRDSKRNCRYIFLPVMTYHSKEEYLKDAIHEVMHISKEEISWIDYRTGLETRQMDSNKRSSALYMNYENGLIERIKLFIFSRRMNLTDNSISDGSEDYAFEETTHHWQVRNVLERLSKKSALTKKLVMPYKLRQVNGTEKKQNVYELADPITKRFMEVFSPEIQRVNRGEISPNSFRRYVGTAYKMLAGLLDNRYRILSEEYRKAVEHKTKRRIRLLKPQIQQAGISLSASDDGNRTVYFEEGKQLVDEMIKHAAKTRSGVGEQLAIVLEKTSKVLGADLVFLGAEIMNRVKRRKTIKQAKSSQNIKMGAQDISSASESTEIER